MHKKTPDIHEMLHEKGVNWNDYPAKYKEGVFCLRQKIEGTLTATGQEPQKHTQTSVRVFPLLGQWKDLANKEGMLLRGETPVWERLPSVDFS